MSHHVKAMQFPRNRNFWYSILLFAWVLFTLYVMVDEFETATRWRVFRRVIQIILFIYWGVERFRKYRAESMGEREVS